MFDMKKQQAFSLVELLIVVAIVGIISAVAVPQYGKYVRKARITEALAITEQAKNALIEYHIKRGKFVPNYGDVSKRNKEIGLAVRTEYTTNNVDLLWVGSRGVRGADSTSAHIAVMLPPELGIHTWGNNSRLLSTIEYRNGEYHFICNNHNGVWKSNIKPEYVPAECQKGQ